jgi:predicted dehydrogenase
VTTRNVKLTADAANAKRPDCIRIAQVGLAGGIGFAHINELEKNPRFKLVGGFDNAPHDPQVAAAIGRLEKLGAKIYRSFEELIADPDVEAVDICTPHHFHRPMAVAAMNAGKHALIEKPMATHPDDAEQILAAQRSSGKIAAVQMQHVGRSSMLKLREAIQSGALGKIEEVFLASLWWRTEEYYGRIPWAGRMKIGGAWCVDGVLYNQTIHYINQMLTLLSSGPLPAVAKTRDLTARLYRFHDAANLEAGDTAFVRAALDTPDSPKLTFVGSTCSIEERHSIEILGQRGRALWNGTGYLLLNGEPVKEFHDDGKEFDGNSRIFNSFAEAIRTGGAPVTDIRQIQYVTRFINDCYESCNWRIKKAPWSATKTLFRDTIQAVLAERKLPHELTNPPSWA